MDGVVKAIRAFLAACLSIMTIVTVLEVARRYIFGLSYPWAEELVRFLLIWVTFVGGAAAFRTGNLVILDTVLTFLSDRRRNVLKLVTNTVVLAFLIFLLRNASKYAFSPVIIKQISPGLGLPMTVPYISIPLGFALMILFALEIYGITIMRLRKE
jgi:TRAP-type C4-dicarboxylate transport system permease small subunit